MTGVTGGAVGVARAWIWSVEKIVGARIVGVRFNRGSEVANDSSRTDTLIADSQHVVAG